MKTEIDLAVSNGELKVSCYIENNRPFLVIRGLKFSDTPIVRLHSACVFGESLGAVDCDCGEQLRSAVSKIIKYGGFVIYGWDEGRGLGIDQKINAIFLQQSQGLDTAQAFEKLGHPPEPRSFKDYVAVLEKVLDGEKVKLASNNPSKLKALEKAGIKVVERTKLTIQHTKQREKYLNNKRAALGHLSDDG